MQARVEAAIARLDYRRNVNASSLRRLDRKTATIGLVLEDVANPFMSALHRAVEDCARERGVLVFAGSCDEDSAREQELISALRTRRVDGIIVVRRAPITATSSRVSAGDGDGLRDRRPGFPTPTA
jgi:LacI family transcriptional regulator